MKLLDTYRLLLLKRSTMIKNDITRAQGTNSLFNRCHSSNNSCFNFRTGSIERLVDGDKRVIATKHLLPENNINVVVR